MLATERYSGSEPVNLGSGNETSMRELIALVTSLVGFRGECVWDATKPNGQPRRCLDVSRAAAFGFRARTDLRDGLRTTVEWYRRARLPV